MEDDGQYANSAPGRILGSVLLGDRHWLSPIENEASQLISTDSAGDYLVPDRIAGRLVEKVRATSRVTQAGGQSMGIDGPAGLLEPTSDSTASWVLALGPKPASTIGFARIALKPKKIAATAPWSEEAREDVANLSSTLSGAVAAELDRAALLGSGAEHESQGVMTQSDTESVNPDYS